MAVVIKGGPELRARLGALASSQMKVDINRQWQHDTTAGAKAAAPHRTGKGAASIHEGFVSDTRAFVMGAWYLIFKDRGTKKHAITPKGISGSGRGGKSSNMLLTSGYTTRKSASVGKGGTIFGRKANVRGIRKSGFATIAGQKALHNGQGVTVIEQTWSRKRRAGRYSKAA